MNRFYTYKCGVTLLGSAGINTQGRIGGYNQQGRLRIEFDDGKFTVLFYYNRPDKGIPYSGRYYLHETLPAYMIKFKQQWHVGTHEELTEFLNKDRNDYR